MSRSGSSTSSFSSSGDGDPLLKRKIIAQFKRTVHRMSGRMRKSKADSIANEFAKSMKSSKVQISNQEIDFLRERFLFLKVLSSKIKEMLTPLLMLQEASVMCILLPLN